VLKAFKKVKPNKGVPGIDGVSIEECEKDLKNNLFKLWNRMSSESYYPMSFKGVKIPKSKIFYNWTIE